MQLKNHSSAEPFLHAIVLKLDDKDFSSGAELVIHLAIFFDFESEVFDFLRDQLCSLSFEMGIELIEQLLKTAEKYSNRLTRKEDFHYNKAKLDRFIDFLSAYLTEIAEAHAKEGKIEEALKYNEKVHELRPEDEKILRDLVIAYQDIGNFDNAEELLEGVSESQYFKTKPENIYETLESRSFIQHVTDEKLVQKLLENPSTIYVGFDTAYRSLHVGNLLPIMTLIHLQKAGHRPIALIGGGTSLVGDPSRKEKMNPFKRKEEVDQNVERIKQQLSRFIDFSQGKAIIVNNADWLLDLNYMHFLREIGPFFNVNRMMSSETHKERLKRGLNFFELNYQVLQAYDYWYLFKNYNCYLQIGGDDQWGNILAGVDLIRRKEFKKVHGLTIPLLTTSSGIKMGKTQQKIIWIDPELTHPYDYYQYWINQNDVDIGRLLSLFTFLPMDLILSFRSLKGVDIVRAKEVLAYEATKICHGKQEATKARIAAQQLFRKKEYDFSDYVPTYTVDHKDLEGGFKAYQLFEKAGLCKTRSEARRVINAKGGYVNNKRIESFDQIVDSKDLVNDSILLRKGKKKYLRISVQ